MISSSCNMGIVAGAPVGWDAVNWDGRGYVQDGSPKTEPSFFCGEYQPMREKVCVRCQLSKILSCFLHDRREPDGFRKVCRLCEKKTRPRYTEDG